MRRLVVLVSALAALSFAHGAAAAVWCGDGPTATDRPDTVTGAQVHLVYAIPSDGVDAFASFASEIATDAETADGWWRGQDPTRTPRFDVAAFPGCSGFGALDVSSVRLGLGSAQLLSSAGRYAAMLGALPSFGRWKKTVVYYDGPIDDPTLCGTGGGSFSSGADSLAIVFPRSSCARTQSLRAAVMVHELTHELGAPDGRQPHECPGGDRGHVCDSDHDLMYPYLSVDAIDQLVLDVGRDDYYRNPGPSLDVSASAWLRRLEGPQQPLALSIAGVGTVTSDVPGVACTAACTTQWDYASAVTLVAEPGPDQRFVGWKGGCTGLACPLTLTGPTSVEAVFAPLLRLKASVAGRGRVLAPGLACPAVCAARVDADAPVKVTAKPAVGWRFAGWTGACRGTKLVCRVVPKADLAVRARFTKTTR